jgi:tRNA-dihydrouridine synthase B
MNIGGINIGKKIIAAPMAEVTDAPFRKISKEFGAALTFTQMVSADGVVKNNFVTTRYLSFSRDEKPIGVQILGNDPKILSAAVKEINKFSPDVIDLNCGCPVQHVRSFNLGSSILSDTKLLGKLVKSMYDAAEGTPVSAKLRLGACQSEISIVENAKAAEDNGAAFITVHFRSIADRYSVKPEYKWMEELKKNIKIPIVANGSIFEPHDAISLINDFGADAVMAARGIIGNPFLISRFNTIINGGDDPGHPDLNTASEILMKHLRLLVREFGEILALDKAKKQTIWYLRFFDGIQILIGRVLQSRTILELYDVIETHKISVRQGVFQPVNYSEIQLKFEEKVLFWLINENEDRINSKIA